jgi:hypothetical protein
MATPCTIDLINVRCFYAKERHMTSKRRKTDTKFPSGDWAVGHIFQVTSWGELQTSGKYVRVGDGASSKSVSFQGNFKLTNLSPPGFKCCHETSAGEVCTHSFSTGSGLFQLQRHLLGHFIVKAPPQKRGPKKRALGQDSANATCGCGGGGNGRFRFHMHRAVRILRSG